MTAKRARPSPRRTPVRRKAAPLTRVLRLYVTGTTGKSVRAIENVRRICDEHLAGEYELEVIDLYKNLPLARGDQMVAAPTLIKRLRLPLRRLIGDMSDEAKVLIGLDVRPKRRAATEGWPNASLARTARRCGGCERGCARPRTRCAPSATDTSMPSS